MIRVLSLIKGLGRGGAEQLLVSAMRCRDRSRFEHMVGYLLPEKDALVSELLCLGVSVRCFGQPFSPVWLARLIREVRVENIDVVHIHSPLPAIGARLVLPLHVPVVYTEHNVWPRYRLATRWGNMLTFPRNNHVFAVSDRVRHSVRLPGWWFRGYVPAVETLYHGPDPSAFLTQPGTDRVREELGISPRAPIVGTVGNLKAHKGHGDLFQAALQIRSRLPEMRLVVVGAGPLEEELRAATRRLGLEETVVFTGFREDVPRLLRAFDVFVLSSRFEGLSIALVEAMAAGIPPVVTDVGGLAEVVRDGENGFVVPPENPPILSERIIQLLSNRTLRNVMGERARERAAAFDIRVAVRRMEEVYERVAAPPDSGTSTAQLFQGPAAPLA
jgi:glycosyltransferase involved in cell wall biosynthesis